MTVFGVGSVGHERQSVMLLNDFSAVGIFGCGDAPQSTINFAAMSNSRIVIILDSVLDVKCRYNK